MPEFCRHNRFRHRCPICSREQGAARDTNATSRRPSPRATTASRARRAPSPSSGSLRVRREARAPDDGYESWLVPGLRSSQDARRLADDIGRAAGRMAALAGSPPGLYAEAASEPDREEGLWLVFLIAYLGPLDDGDPWAGIRAARTSWRAGGGLAQVDVPVGPRGAHDPDRGTLTADAYRAWAERSGSQQAGIDGQPAWSPERRFARALERLALPGLHRDARFELLVTAGRLGLADLRASTLALGGADPTGLAARRVFGIADPLLLDRRAITLAEAAELPLDALDGALWSFGRGAPAGLGVPADAFDEDARGRAAAALGID
jgi:hypothetical protein